MTKLERAIGLMEELRMRQGPYAGQACKLMKHQREVVEVLFSRLDPETKRRLIRFLFCFWPRGNAKTSFAAQLCLALLMIDKEQGAEIFAAANDKDQAGILYEDCAYMVRTNDELNRRLECRDYYKTIKYTATAGKIRAISAEVAGAYGLRPSAVVYDEIHLWKDRRLFDALDTAMGKREQPLGIAITTAGVVGQSEVCAELYDYAKKVDGGLIEDQTFHPSIYEANKDDDWTSEKVWQRVNPGWGITVQPDHLRDQCKKALEIPSRRSVFKREHLNMWMASAETWLAVEKWDACHVDEWPDLGGMVCYGGVDLSETTDLTAFVLAFPVDDLIYLLPMFYMPRDTAVEREKQDRVPYTEWARSGHVTLTPGNVVDYTFIRADIREAAEKYDLRSVGFDPWRARQLSVQVAEEDGIYTVSFRQGYTSMAAPCLEFEKRVVGGTFRHDGSPVMRNHIATVPVRKDAAGNMKPDRSQLKKWQRIDGVVAAVMATGLCLDHVHQPASVYETRGALYMDVR